MMVKMPMPPSFHFEVNCEVHHAFTLGDLIRHTYWTLGEYAVDVGLDENPLGSGHDVDDCRE